MRSFPKKMSWSIRWYIAIYANFPQKGEFMDSVDPRGNISPRPYSRELSACSRLILAKNHLSKSNNPFDMFALEANVLFIAKQVCTLFLLFRSCSNRKKTLTARTLVHQSIRICRIEYMTYWIPNIGYIPYYTMSRGYSKEPSQRNACFCVFKRFFCKTRTECKNRLE